MAALGINQAVEKKEEDKSDDRTDARVNSKLKSGFSILQLSPRDREAFAAAILNPPVAKKRLLAAAKRFKERMGK